MADPEIREDLRRDLGFWTALTIGAGTMIGAGIFLLSGVALQQAGPGAILAFVAAGVVCMITASSAAELATGMPTSGGDYYFVSRSLGPALGAISGIGIWLSLTFAIAFYLFGMGEYLSRFLPVTPFWGAVAGGVGLTALNVIGAKESGRAQVVVVVLLFAILGGFAAYGAVGLETRNLIPFLPYGAGPILPTTALVFVSFLGFGKIAAVAEEIRDPARNLPRALIGSVALVTVLYVVILLVVAGLFPQREIVDVTDPLVAGARILFGPAGVVIIVFAGLLATLSSANASIMASSRINLAMARDRLVPGFLSAVHQRFMTPHRAILLTGILALVFLLIDSLEDLAKIASSLQLYSYAALNVGCIALRTASPEWYRPSYRTPGSPFLQIAAAVACIAIIFVSGLFAQLAVVGLILLSLFWYFTWGRSRMEIEHALPPLRARLSQFGLAAFFQTPQKHAAEPGEEAVPTARPVGPNPPRTVTVAIANPAHGSDLLHLGRLIATGAEAGGRVHGVHLVRAPLQTPIQEIRRRLAEDPEERNRILKDLDEPEAFRIRPAREGEDDSVVARGVEAAGARGDSEPDEARSPEGRAPADAPPPRRPVEDTVVEAHVDAAHDVFRGLVSETHFRRSDLLLMGWEGSFSVGQVYRSPVQRIMGEVEADLAVFKDRGLEQVRSIVLPWGGGVHARLGLELAARIGGATAARLTVLRLVREDVDIAEEEEALARSVERVIGAYPRLELAVRTSGEISEGVMEFLSDEAGEVDLVVIGASRESRIRQVLFGSIPDMVADQASASVLMVHRYLPAHWSWRAAALIKRAREKAGFTTSPEEGATNG